MVTTIDDVIRLWRKLTPEEIERTEALIETIEANLKVESKKANKDLKELLEDGDYKTVFKSVVVDVVARTLMTSTSQEPMIQTSESALGYSWSGTFLNPGGGLFIKKSELDKLGLGKKQRYGALDIYGTPKRDYSYFVRED